MKTHLVSYASQGYIVGQEILAQSALQHGIDHVFKYRREDIVRMDLYPKHKRILDLAIGDGVFAWKPLVIYDALMKIEEGDILVYSDCDVQIVSDMSPLFDICRRQGGVMLFNGHSANNRQCNRRDIFVAMDCDSEEYWNAIHPWAGFNLWMKDKRNLDFVSEWLRWCNDDRAVRDLPNVCGKENLPGYINHAHDEAVFSILAVKYKIELYRTPAPNFNFAKPKEFRIPGENLGIHWDYPIFTPRTEYEEPGFLNSPYPNILCRHDHPQDGQLFLTAHEVLVHGLRYHRDGTYKDITSAIWTYGKVLEFDPNNIEAHYLLGLGHYQIRHFNRAEEHFDRVLTLKPDLLEAYYGQFHACQAMGKQSKAEWCLNRIISVDPTFLYMKKGLDSSALDLPSFKRAWVRVYWRGENFDGDFYLREYPDVASAVQQGVFPSAWEHYKKFGYKENRRAIPSEPPLPLPPAQEAEAAKAEVARRGEEVEQLLQRGDFGAAKDLAQKILADWPFHPLPYTLLGLVGLHAGDDSLAEDNFKKAAALAPSGPAAYLGLTSLYLRQSNLQQAERELEKAEQVAPANPAVLQLASLIRSKKSVQIAAESASSAAPEVSLGYREGWDSGPYEPPGNWPQDWPLRLFIEKHVPPGDGDCIELGCYAGAYLRLLGDMGYRVNGIDYTTGVRGMDTWFAANGYRVGEIIYGDLTTHEFTRKFDVVCSFGLIEHFVNWHVVLLKQARLVSENGLALVGVPNFSGLYQRVLRKYFDAEDYKRHCPSSMSTEHWARMLELIGFEILEHGPIWKCEFPIGKGAIDSLSPDKRLLLSLVETTCAAASSLDGLNGFHTAYYLALAARRKPGADPEALLQQAGVCAAIDEVVQSALEKDRALDSAANTIVAELSALIA